MPTIGALTVHLRDQSGTLHAFTPGEQVPDWAAKQMGAHCFAETAVSQPAKQLESRAASGPVAPVTPSDGVPAQFGPDARRDVWAEYAQSHGVTVAEDWKRGQIIDACREAGVPVE